MTSTIYIYTFFSFPFLHFKVFSKRLLIQVVFPFDLVFSLLSWIFLIAFVYIYIYILPMWKIKLFIRHQSVSSTSFLLTRIYSESFNNGRFCTDTAIWQLVRIWKWYRNPPARCWRKEKKSDEQAQVTMKNGNKDDHEK